MEKTKNRNDRNSGRICFALRREPDLRLRKQTGFGGKKLDRTSGNPGCPPGSAGNWLCDPDTANNFSQPQFLHLTNKEWG